MTKKSLELIKKLWMKFDPIGVYQLDSEWPENEYDAYVTPTYELLKTNASNAKLKAFITKVLEHMGLETDNKAITKFINKLQSLKLE